MLHPNNLSQKTDYRSRFANPALLFFLIKPGYETELRKWKLVPLFSLLFEFFLLLLFGKLFLLKMIRDLCNKTMSNIHPMLLFWKEYFSLQMDILLIYNGFISFMCLISLVIFRWMFKNFSVLISSRVNIDKIVKK